MKETDRTEMVLGVFSERGNAEDAINELKDTGYDPKDISVIMKDTSQAGEIHKNTGAKVAGSVATGAVAGGVVGGLAGLLIGIGAIAIPGIGAILIGGPIAAALGLSGAAATTVSGAATGILAGGIAGALVGLGIAGEDAKLYEERVKAGDILIAVPSREGNQEEAKDILSSNRAEMVKAYHMNIKGRAGQKEPGIERAAKKTVAKVTGKSTTGDRGSRSGKGMRHETHIVNPIQVQKYLKGIDYPVSKEDLINHAREEGADDNVISTLRDMKGTNFSSPKQVSEAIGQES